MNEIVIKNIINSGFASDNDQGNLVFNEISSLLDKSDSNEIYLNFNGLEILTTAFLNNAIGKIYRNYSLDVLSGRIKIKNLKDRDDLELLRLVILNAMDIDK